MTSPAGIRRLSRLHPLTPDPACGRRHSNLPVEFRTNPNREDLLSQLELRSLHAKRPAWVDAEREGARRLALKDIRLRFNTSQVVAGLAPKVRRLG